MCIQVYLMTPEEGGRKKPCTKDMQLVRKIIISTLFQHIMSNTEMLPIISYPDVQNLLRFPTSLNCDHFLPSGMFLKDMGLCCLCRTGREGNGNAWRGCHYAPEVIPKRINANTNTNKNKNTNLNTNTDMQSGPH